jgi:UDP-N-acetylmuramoyl-L-alanyl-D-glutamate--2,6-diaminopimelate ligase
MHSIKKIIKKITPKFFLSFYHFALAYIGAFLYGFPSRRMVIIGVVGTRGKTTVGNLLWGCLTAAGYKVGLTGTANIRIGNFEEMNPFHMTMPGRFALQKYLKKMADEGCQFAIVETPSEGVEQSRHKGIFYDVAVLTNLYPEYLAVHNWDFERCKEMDEVIFKTLITQPKKILNNDPAKKIIVVNADLAEKEMFLRHAADIKVTYGIEKSADIHAENIKTEGLRSSFTIEGLPYKLGIIGSYNVQNALAAIATCFALHIKPEFIQKGIQMHSIPGRMEEINEGQSFFTFVDYAHDAVSLESALKSLCEEKKKTQKLIVVFGGQGGGRDVKKLPIMGEVSAQLADTVIITTDDPFDDDPAVIAEKISAGAEKNKKIKGESLFLIPDRREAIQKALSMASDGDIVLITGKGAEQSMVVKGKKIPWDDRKITREELKKLLEVV